MRLDLPQKRSKIDISFATVNIVLLLICFFLISGALVQKEEMDISLAETSDLPLDRLPRPLLSIASDKTLTLNGDSIEKSALRGEVETYFRLNPTRTQTVYILAPKTSSAIELLAFLSNPDFAEIAFMLVTLHLRGGPK